MSPINLALHLEGISEVRVERIRCTDSSRRLGTTTPASTLQDLLRHRDLVLKAAQVANSCVTDLVPQQKWRWIRIHDISLTRYMGGARDGGLRKLREELEAENSGVQIPAEIRWLGGTKVRARFKALADKDGSPSVVAAVLGEATFGRLCKSGVRLFGRRYKVDAIEEAWRPDAFCSRCSEWEHIAPHCLAAAPGCALCAKDHLTADHQCLIEGCRVGKGHPCPHGAAKCANCWNKVTFVLKDDRWPGAWSDCSFDPHTQCTHTHKLYIKIFPPVFLSTHCTLEFISFSHQPSITLPTRLPSCPSITSTNLRISLSSLHLFLTQTVADPMGRGLVPAAKREARLAASGWRSAPRERRERDRGGRWGSRGQVARG